MSKKKTKSNLVQLRTKHRNEMIYETLFDIDWVKIHNVMKFLNWTWDGKLPTIEDLKDKGLELFNNAFDEFETGHNLGQDWDTTHLSHFFGGLYARLTIENNELISVGCGFTLDWSDVDVFDSVFEE